MVAAEEIQVNSKDLGKAIKRAPTLKPTLEETKNKFAGATVFSKLDAKYGYWSIVYISRHLQKKDEPHIG